MKNLITVMLATIFTVGISVAQERGGRQGQNRTPEEMAKLQVEHLTKELELNKGQQDSIYKYTLESSKEQRTLMQNSEGGDRQAIFEKMRALREKNSTKIKTFLNESQSAKYEELQKQMQQCRRPRNDN